MKFLRTKNEFARSVATKQSIPLNRSPRGLRPLANAIMITSAILLLAAACNKQAVVEPVSTPMPVTQSTPTDQTANWKTSTYNSLFGLTDWTVKADAKTNDNKTPDLGYCRKYKQDAKSKIFEMSKVFNADGFNGTTSEEVNAQLDKAEVAETELIADAKNVLKSNGWTLCKPTKQGEVGYDTLSEASFYYKYLYVKDNHVLLLSTGSRDAVTGGMYVLVQFEY